MPQRSQEYRGCGKITSLDPSWKWIGQTLKTASQYLHLSWSILIESVESPIQIGSRLVEHILKPIKPKSTAGTTKNNNKKATAHITLHQAIQFLCAPPTPLRLIEVSTTSNSLAASAKSRTPQLSESRKKWGGKKKYVIGIIYIYISYIYISVIRIIYNLYI